MAKGEWVVKEDFQVTSQLTRVVYSWNKGQKFIILDAYDDGMISIKDKGSNREIITSINDFHEFMEPV